MEDSSSGGSSTSSTVTPNSLEAGIEASPSSPRRPCTVCLSEDAWNRHYGAWSCASCKAFFRRAIIEEQEEKYSCRKSNQCYDYTVRPRVVRCRACRFAKCLSAGMKKSKLRCGPAQETIEKNRRMREKTQLIGCYSKLVQTCNGVEDEIRRFKEAEFQKVEERLPHIHFPEDMMVDGLEKKKEVIISVLGAIEYAKRFQLFHWIKLDDRIKIVAYFSMVLLNFEKSRGMGFEEVSSKYPPTTFDLFIRGKIDPFEYNIMKTICFFNPDIEGLSYDTKILMHHNRHINILFLSDFCVKILHTPGHYYDLLGAICTIESRHRIHGKIHGFPTKLSWDFVAQFKGDLDF